MGVLKHHDQLCQTPKSEYEQSREETIRKNLEKMKSLGIVELSLGLNLNDNPLKPRRLANHNIKTPPPITPLQRSSQPSRRSSRLKNVTPANYSEVELKKNKAALFDDEILLGKSARPEIYTEEHDKLLGSTAKSWTLFVDGYGRDGKRIYDQVKGKTCHQCRQKTLGYRTHCSICTKVQGQFCGDCLYMRYGEHVLEANENPDWICPVCRGICNCSLCRVAKGWAPTGPFYKKITRLGFKSVAHYLIQTCRSEENKSDDDTANKVSVKRSLAFSDVDAKCGPSELVDKSDDKDSFKKPLPILTLTPCSESFGVFAETEEKMNQENCTTELEKTSLALQAMNSKSIAERLKSRNRKGIDPDYEVEKQLLALVVVPSANSIGGRLRQRCKISERDVNGVEKSEVVVPSDGEHLEDENIGPWTTTPKLEKKRALEAEPSSDSIGGRLRQRRKTSDDVNLGVSHQEAEPKLNQALALVVVPSSDRFDGRLRQRSQAVKDVLSETEAEKIIETPSKTTHKLNQKRALVVVPSSDSIGGRLRQRNLAGKDVSSETKVEISIESPSKTTQMLKQKHSPVVLTSSDSIGARLRQRRKITDVENTVSSRVSLEKGNTPCKITTPKLNKQLALVVVPSSDSIGGRLRMRRSMIGESSSGGGGGSIAGRLRSMST